MSTDLNAIKKELNLKSYEEVIKALLRSEKRLKKSYFGAFPELPEFKRDEERNNRRLTGKIIVSAVNVAEVYNSFLRDYSHPDNERYAEASRKAMKQRSYVYEVDEEIAVDSAKIKHEKKWGLGDSIIFVTTKREGFLEKSK